MHYRSNHNIVFSCEYRVVWCPKYRRKVLHEKIAKRFKQIASELAQERGVTIIEMEVIKQYIESQKHV